MIGKNTVKLLAEALDERFIGEKGAMAKEIEEFFFLNDYDTSEAAVVLLRSNIKGGGCKSLLFTHYRGLAEGPLLEKLCEDLIASADDPLVRRDRIPDLIRSLEYDGYAVVGGKLYRPDTAVMDTVKETHALLAMYRELGLGEEEIVSTALEKIQKYYIEKDWTTANKYARDVFDHTCRQIVLKMGTLGGPTLDARGLRNAADVRIKLGQNGILIPEEEKTLADFYAQVNEYGAHGTLADAAQAQLTQHMLLGWMQFLLQRLKEKIAATT